MAWFVAWMFLVFDTPENHPRISGSEKTYIQQSLKGATGAQKDVKVRYLFRQFLTKNINYNILSTLAESSMVQHFYLYAGLGELV